MAECDDPHSNRNLPLKLTSSEKRVKKLRKMFDDNGLEVVTAVYGVSDLSDTKRR